MLEFVAVETPTVFPQACIACKQQKGPFVDTHGEIGNGMHVYVCSSCVSRGARALGLPTEDTLAALMRENTELTELVGNVTAESKAVSKEQADIRALVREGVIEALQANGAVRAAKT